MLLFMLGGYFTPSKLPPELLEIWAYKGSPFCKVVREVLVELELPHLLHRQFTLSYLAVKVICDHVTGKSKGYGFVQFNSETAAGTALREMDGQTYTHSLWTQGVMADVYAFIMDTRGDHKELRFDSRTETTNGSSGIPDQASPQKHQRSSFGSHEMQPSNRGGYFSLIVKRQFSIPLAQNG
ncbi:hypothetical protein TEA_010559 [Camellia sinensis var. sinensis]|uniref:RRM domain-containing protein n=1 Tax=Camellia sinensis var. sinensis TaxID=542762 RepID=A0A4S4E340_CAMSN|nr:hypothetical protein TEA_010559 [Camellia sinensis var. sinensis]